METDELVIDGQPVRQVWRCEAPAEGATYQVISDHWDLQSTPWVRCIHEVRVAS